MDEWFKARLSWGNAIRMLSDAEAGRFVKALWTYAETGDAGNINGGERLLIAMCTATLSQDEEHRTVISAKRSQAGKKGGRPQNSKANESKKSNCFFEKANESKKSNCNHIRNKNKESSSVGFFADDDEAFAIAADHQEVLDAAERVGLGSNETERDKIIDLFAIHGKPALLSALDDFAEHKGRSIAYLRKILAGSPKPQEDDPLSAGNWL